MRNLFMLTIALVLAIIISGCAATPTVPPAAYQPPDNAEEMEITEMHHNARNSLDWHGVYQGVIPSASGMGIRVELVLWQDEVGAGAFSLTYEYLQDDMPIPELANSSWAQWSEQAGSESGTFIWDETGNIIRLDLNNWPPYYRVGENMLTQLDMSGNPITGELADSYVLTRIIAGPTPLPPEAALHYGEAPSAQQNVPLTDDLGVPVEIVPEEPPHALLALWEREGYPDDIGGVYFDNDSGSLALLLVNPTPERIAELRALAGHDLIITPSTYSYNELRRIQDEIWAEVGADSKIFGVGVGWTSDEDRNVIGFGESGKEFRVLVWVDETVFEHYSSEFARRFGGRVVVEISEPNINF